LKATDTDKAIRKCLIGQSPFLQEENFCFFEDTKKAQKS